MLDFPNKCSHPSVYNAPLRGEMSIISPKLPATTPVLTVRPGQADAPDGRNACAVSSPDTFGNFSTQDISALPLASGGAFAKRALDLVSASTLLVMTLPLLVLIALMIRFIDGGPVLFRQTRIGLHGAPFSLLKFRTMSEASSNEAGAANHANVTALGRHLRRWGLDEFPQLLNVLAGQMSMVGPRPHTQADDAQWMESIDAYAERRKVKPGITGWAQVNGFHGFSSGDEALYLRTQLDIEYMKNWSLLFDLRILIMTIFELPMDQRENRAS